MPYTVDRPSPVPLPFSLVVKNGSKMRARVCSSMPQPVSVTASCTYDPGFTATWQRRVLLVDLHVGGLDRELAALGHGVAGVDHEVHEHLLDLTRVGQGQAEVGRERLDELDVFAEDPPEHLLDTRGDLVEVEADGLQHLLAAEGQKLPGQRHRAIGGFLHLREIVS